MMGVMRLSAAGPRWKQKLVYQAICELLVLTYYCRFGLTCVQDIEMNQPLYRACKKMIKIYCEVSTSTL